MLSVPFDGAIRAYHQIGREQSMAPDKKTFARHNFAIWVLGKKPGFFRPQRYIYRCLRCKWAFVINDGQRGEVRVAHENGAEIDPEEGLRRLATLSDGPCPGFISSSLRPVAHLESVPSRNHEPRRLREADKPEPERADAEPRNRSSPVSEFRRSNREMS
jgi:hypothetical protein